MSLCQNISKARYYKKLIDYVRGDHNKADVLTVFSEQINKKLNSFKFKLFNKYFKNSRYIKSFKEDCQDLFIMAINKKLINISYECLKNKRFSNFIYNKELFSKALVLSVKNGKDYFEFFLDNYKDRIDFLDYNEVLVDESLNHYLYQTVEDRFFTFSKGYFEENTEKINESYMYTYDFWSQDYVNKIERKERLTNVAYQCLFHRKYDCFDILFENKLFWNKINLDSKLLIIKDYSLGDKDLEPDMVLKMIKSLDIKNIPKEYLINCFVRFITDEWYNRYFDNIDLVLDFKEEILEKIKLVDLSSIRKEGQAKFLDFLLKENKEKQIKKKINKI